MTIDLNCDMGELADVALEEALMRTVSSANVACGGHAGDAATMARTVSLARQYGVAVGAHPGYPDRENFGRVEMPMSPAQLSIAVAGQIRALVDIAGHLTHVKPHGALYNVAAKDAGVARVIAEGVAAVNPKLVLVGLAGSAMLVVWREMGFRTAAEGLADRCYEPDGSLRSRKLDGALITNPAQAAAQALKLAHDGRVETICVHSDTPGSVRILEAVSEALRNAGVIVQPLLRD
jgi:UPF0271 protein